MNYKQNKGCSVCGFKEEPRILEFHHNSFEKKVNSINKLMKSLKGIEIIEKEISKCVLICPNCHRRLHLDKKGI